MLIRIIVGLVILSMCASASTVSAAVVRSGDSVSIPEEAHVEGDFYAVGNNIYISGAVSGDVYVLGGTVTMNGSVVGDIVVLGGTVSITGTVGDDVRILGGRAVVGGGVEGDVFSMGGALTVLSTSHVNGDVLFYGGAVRVEGDVEGVLTGHAESAAINGTVGAVDIKVQRPLLLSENAHVEGDVSYQSAHELSRSQDTVIGGVVNRKDEIASQEESFTPHLTLWFIVLFSALVMVLLGKERLVRLFEHSAARLGISGLIGCGALIALPLASALLFVSLLGSLIGVVLLLFSIGLILLSFIGAHILIGALLAQLFTKRFQVTWLWAAVGVVAMQLALYIPVVGFLVLCGATLIFLGMVIQHLYRWHVSS